jgi:isopentenyl-diphosphate delta-isomerase type 1
MPEEILDIVDEQDNILGCTSRTLVHQLGLRHRGAHVFLFTPDRRLLVQRRQHDRETWPGALDCSVSEHVKSGEGYLQAALRGLEEELGLGVTELRLVLHFAMNYGPNDNEISQVFEGEVDPKAVRADTREVESVTYYSLEQLWQMIDEREELFCRWFEEMLLWYGGKSSDIQVLGNA